MNDEKKEVIEESIEKVGSVLKVLKAIHRRSGQELSEEIEYIKSQLQDVSEDIDVLMQSDADYEP